MELNSSSSVLTASKNLSKLDKKKYRREVRSSLDKELPLKLETHVDRIPI
jgi:hypothetical protein